MHACHHRFRHHLRFRNSYLSMDSGLQLCVCVRKVLVQGLQREATRRMMQANQQFFSAVEWWQQVLASMCGCTEARIVKAEGIVAG
jgi:hypothetical protein